MAKVSCGWNLIHPSPFLWQRTCCILLSFVSRNALWHGKSVCYEVLQLFHCFYCRLAYSSLRTRSEWGFGIRWNIELATFFECLYFQLANLNFNSHFASLQAWVLSPGAFRHHSLNIAGHCLLIAGEIDDVREMLIGSNQLGLYNPPYDKYNSAQWYLWHFC